MLKILHTLLPVGPITAISNKSVSRRTYLSSKILLCICMKMYAGSFSKIMEICLSLTIKERTLKYI
jgi:hypothetical protein